jgi:hypothetical protein
MKLQTKIPQDTRLRNAAARVERAAAAGRVEDNEPR